MKTTKPLRETLAQAGYQYAGFNRQSGAHILREISTGKLELWAANKGHASYGITWRNTHLEFLRSLNSL